MYSYKLGKNKQHKNPHAIGLKAKVGLKKQGYKGELKIHERERLSDRPFGYVTTKGKFRVDIDKVPFYNVPDLTGFYLKPYVPHTTPKVGEEIAVKRLVELDEQTLAYIEKAVEAATRGRLESRD